MMVGLHEVIDGEVVLTVIEPGTTADDLFELDNLVDRPHQDNVADITGVHPG